MRYGKSSFLALVLLAGLTSSASAQGFGAVGGVGINSGFRGNGFNSGYNNFGGGYNNFGGGYNNFGGGYNSYYNRNYSYPQTYNNMGGLMNSIRTQTGGGNSYRYGSGPALGGRRR